MRNILPILFALADLLPLKVSILALVLVFVPDKGTVWIHVAAAGCVLPEPDIKPSVLQVPPECLSCFAALFL